MNCQGRRNGGGNRRKNSRKTNQTQQQKQRQQTQTECENMPNSNEQDDEQTRIVPDLTNENDYDDDDEQISRQYSDNEQDQIENYENSQHRIPAHVGNQQQASLATKQYHKNKTIDITHSKDESVQLSKPQASVAPVKQTSLSPRSTDPSNQQDHYLKSSSYNNYSYSNYNPLPPRFQRQQRENTYFPHKHRRKRSGGQMRPSSFSPESAERTNDFIPSSVIEQQQQQSPPVPASPPPPPPPQQQQQQQLHVAPQMYYNQVEAPPMEYMQRPEYFMHNGYSSESDIVTDSSPMVANTSLSSVLSTPTSSESSLQRLDLVRSLSSSNDLLEELIAIFDTISFSSDELELILNKIATKHVLDKHDAQRIISAAKNDKTLERILEETYRSQAKILAIELQTEKNRVLELTKSNADMENTIRQFQQQPNTIVQYQQMIMPYQMQLRRLADENTRLQHQLHAYAMMPATLNELKQQHYILNEQIRQLTLRNSALENEAAESRRASKHAAEIYKKADTQKQERIEQMIADINKYRKLDKELTELRQKHVELEKNLNGKISDITQERDQLKDQCDSYEKPPSCQHFEQQINELKKENDELRQANWQAVEQLNKCISSQTSSAS